MLVDYMLIVFWLFFDYLGAHKGGRRPKAAAPPCGGAEGPLDNQKTIKKQLKYSQQACSATIF